MHSKTSISILSHNDAVLQTKLNKVVKFNMNLESLFSGEKPCIYLEGCAPLLQVQFAHHICMLYYVYLDLHGLPRLLDVQRQ